MNVIKYYWEMILDVFDFRKIGRIILYILFCILLVFISSCRQAHKDAKILEAELAAQKDELTAIHAEQIAELQREYEYGGDIGMMEYEAECIAKVLYGTARNHSSDGQRAVVWCILNRVDHQSYPDTVVEVCAQPQQWMGYDERNPVLDNLYDVALETLKVWYNDGHRPMSPDYIFMSWSANEIVLRDKFEENRGTHYWRVG